MHLGNLKPTPRIQSKRIGRGNGSGNGKTCGRGHKGQQCRSGGGVAPWFEGGQMPLYRRLPIRGFNNARFKKSYQIVNLASLTKFESGEISAKELYAAGLIGKEDLPVKILGDGELKVALKITADKFTKKAVEKITAQGGEAIQK